MSQHQNNTSPSAAQLQFTFPPIPLASGGTVVDAQGAQHPVTRVRIVIDTTCGADPVEIEIDWIFGGWWAPIPVVATGAIAVPCTDPSH